MLLVLLLPAVSAAMATDPAGDVAVRAFGEPVDRPAVDILQVQAEAVQGSLELAMRMAGELPIDAPEQRESQYSYLFVVGRGTSGRLFEENDLTLVCTFHHGGLDLQCSISDGEGALRRSAASGRNVTATVDVSWEGPLRVGAMAHESVPNGTQRDIVAQDFTENALPYQQGPEPDDPPAPRPTPWWRTPWVLLAALLAAVAAGVAWSRLRR